MATIRRVTIHRLRNVKPGSTFELHPGLNVLLGQNGTGKTTLLQWMADCLSGNLESWSKEPYHVEVEMEAGTGPNTASLRLVFDNEVSEPLRNLEQAKLGFIASLLEQQVSHGFLTISVAIEVDADRYEIEEKPSHLTFRANGTSLVESDTMRTSPRMLGGLFLELLELLLFQAAGGNSDIDPADRSAPRAAVEHLLSMTPDLMLQIRRFDESLGFFHHIVAGSTSQTQLGLTQSGERRFGRLVPHELSQLVSSKVSETDSDVQTLTFTSEEVNGFLATAVRLFQYHSAKMHFAMMKKDVNGPEPISTYGDLRFTFHRHDDSIIKHDDLSYGQKRMLSFLYYLALHPRLIIVDELVNGLHHAWIEACIDEIGDRQGLLTSQNPLLLDSLPFESVAEVRQRLILCRSERENGREQLVWRNPTQEEAESFFRAYQAGIQHVGEILIDKGLW